jgi:hypothetical protein
LGKWIGVNYKPQGKKVGAKVGAKLNFRVRWPHHVWHKTGSNFKTQQIFFRKIV